MASSSRTSSPQSGAPAIAYNALRPASVAGSRRLFTSRGRPLGRYDDVEELSSGSEDELSSGSLDNVAVNDRRACPGRSNARFFSEADLADWFHASRRGWWLPNADDDAVLLKVPMQGLGKELVKVWVENDALLIKGTDGKEFADADEDDDGYELRYCRRGRGRRRRRLRAALLPPHPVPRRRLQDGPDPSRDEGWPAQGHRAQGQEGGDPHHHRIGIGRGSAGPSF